MSRTTRGVTLVAIRRRGSEDFLTSVAWSANNHGMASLPSMNVSLTDELDAFVRQRVEDGRYATSSEVVREGLLLLREREREADAVLAAVRAKLARGSAQADRGEVVDGDVVFAEVDALIARRRAERAAG